MSVNGCSEFVPSHIDHGDGHTTLISFARPMRVISIDVMIPEDSVDLFDIGLNELIAKIT